MTATAALTLGTGSGTGNEQLLGELRSDQGLRYNTELDHQQRVRYNHNALTRTASQPQPQQQYNNNHVQQQQNLSQTHRRQQQRQPVIPATSKDGNSKFTNLVNTLIENLDTMKLHRKLERTQSEPLPQLQLQQQMQVNTSRYKTELCRPFEEAGECKYGEKCQFAHGYHELRNLQRHPKYKTEYCRTFHSVGFCPYGPRCHFVHNADEARAMQQQQQQIALNHSKSAVIGVGAFANNTTTTTSHNCSFNNWISPFATFSGAMNNNNNNNNNTNSDSTTDSGGSKFNLPLSPPLSMSTGSDRESPTGSLSLSPTSSMSNFHFGDVAAAAANGGVGSKTALRQHQMSPSSSAVFHGVTEPTVHAMPSVQTPPDSPNTPISPVNSPSESMLSAYTTQHQSLRRAMPTKTVIQRQENGSINSAATISANASATAMFVKPVCKQILTKSCSSPADTTQARKGIRIIEEQCNDDSSSGTASSNYAAIKAPMKVYSVSSLHDRASSLRVSGSSDCVSTAEDTRLPVFNQLSCTTLDGFVAANNM